MNAARHYRVPHSIFLGRPLPGPGEPLWLDADQDLALQYEQYLAACCPGCGRHPDTNPDDLVVSLEQCRSCEQKAIAQASVPDDEHGYHAFLEPLAIVRAREAAAAGAVG